MNFVALAQELADPPSAGWQWCTEISPDSTLTPYLYRIMAGHGYRGQALFAAAQIYDGLLQTQKEQP